MVVVDVLACLVVAIGVVEDELVVLDVLRDAVHFDLRLVHPDLRVAARHRVDLSRLRFLLEQWPFTHANANVHL